METLPFSNSIDIDDFQDQEPKKYAALKENVGRGNYIPRNVDSKWFESQEFIDKDEELTMTKFRAHAAYKNGDWEKAVDLYRRCREILPSNANLLLREICESEARCHLKLRRYQESQDIINMLIEEKGNPQDSTLCSLLSDVLIATEKLDDAAECLKKCIALHPDYAVYWIKTAHLSELLLASKAEFLKHQTFMNHNLSNGESDKFLSLTENVLETLRIKKDFQSELSNGVNMTNGFLCQVMNKSKDCLSKEADGSCENCRFLSSVVTTEIFWERSQLDFLKGMLDCPSCKLIQDYFLNSLEHASSKNDVFGCLTVGFLKQLLLSKDFKSIFNDLKDINCVENKTETVHLIFWKVLTKIIQCCAVARACQLQSKTVQYSRGFVRDAEYKRALKMQQTLSDLVGCKHFGECLIQILDMPSSIEKEAKG